MGEVARLNALASDKSKSKFLSPRDSKNVYIVDATTRSKRLYATA